MATITVRAIDPVTFDPLQGNGSNNFISDLAAVTQIIKTRLLLFQGEWFLNLLDGLPLRQSILGASASQANLSAIINIISSRIKQSPYVTDINSLVASFSNRSFYYNAAVQTQFGTVYVSNSPASLTSGN